jgi:hypothetical protein
LCEKPLFLASILPQVTLNETDNIIVILLKIGRREGAAMSLLSKVWFILNSTRFLCCWNCQLTSIFVV